MVANLSPSPLALAIPLAAFALTIVGQFFSFRLLRLGLLQSVFAGLFVGCILILLLHVATPAEGILSSFCLLLPLWYCFFHFINIGEASLRIRLLHELRLGGGALTVEALKQKYNRRIIVEKRLERLLNDGQIVQRGDLFYSGKNRFVFLLNFFDFLRSLCGRAGETAGQTTAPRKSTPC